MSEFLCEILCEEIPARMQKKAVEQTGVIFEQILKEKGLKHSQIKTFITPQRIIIFINDLADATECVHLEKRGPRIDTPTKALEGFLKANNLSKDKVYENNGYWCADLLTPAQSTKQILPHVLEQFFKSFTWPKAMYWPQSKQSWIRPIRNILCLFNEKILDYDFKDLGLCSSDHSFGHRFLKNQRFKVSNFADYQEKLQQNCVMFCQESRKNFIKSQLENLAKQNNLVLQEDEGLLEEVIGLVEYPYVGLGNIDKAFMSLPDIVLNTSMRVHQKYFSFFNENKSMAPCVGVVSNVPITPIILEGYERILKARLRDALFFYEHDLKIPLKDLKSKLSNIVLHQKLGSVEKKVDRVIKAATDHLSKQAAALYKCDLLTHMVEEFPELQGKIGKVYALAQGYQKEVAIAIQESYQPHGINDQCPETNTGIQLALLDKFDTLVGFFGQLIKPTGSKDPFALRRCALGIIRIIDDRNQDINLIPIIEVCINSYRDQGISLVNNTKEEILCFLKERLSVFLKDKSYRHDYIAACLSSGDNFYRIIKKCKDSRQFLASENGQHLLTVFNRCNGILGSHQLSQPDNTLFEEVEKKLYEAIQNLREKVNLWLETKDYSAFMWALSDIRPQVDDFFDNVTVNTDDKKLTNNRLSLLQMLRDTMLEFCDWRKIDG